MKSVVQGVSELRIGATICTHREQAPVSGKTCAGFLKVIERNGNQTTAECDGKDCHFSCVYGPVPKRAKRKRHAEPSDEAVAAREQESKGEPIPF